MGKYFTNWPYPAFLRGNFQEHQAPINFSATVVGFHNMYFVLATPYGTEIIIAINSSQLLSFLLNMQVRTP